MAQISFETDEALLGYVSIHCQTERALFAREHVLHLFKLAKRTPPPMPEWVAMREEIAAPLVQRARGFLRLKLV